MSSLAYGVAVWLFVVGLYGVATSRNVVHLTVCLTVMQSSTYVLLLTIGFSWSGTAPILTGLPRSTPTVDPVVQALTLTDVVVSVVVAALILALAVVLHRRGQAEDPDLLRNVSG